MNTTDHFVIKVLSKPYQCEPFTHWFVKVEAQSWGRASENTVMVKTLEEAIAIGKGYRFEA